MGKAKDGTECFTRKKADGGTYVTCKGTQKKAKAKPKAKVPAIKVVKGTKKSIDLKPTQKKPGPNPKAKAKPKAKPQAKPKAKPAPAAPGIQFGHHTSDFMSALSVMTEVAKEKGPSTKADVDLRVKLDKRARGGKLTQKELIDYLENEDSGRWHEALDDDTEGRREVQSDNMEYWIERVSKRAEQWSDLSDYQHERLSGMMEADKNRDQKQWTKQIFAEYIKGKKFKDVRRAADVFIDHFKS